MKKWNRKTRAGRSLLIEILYSCQFLLKKRKYFEYDDRNKLNNYDENL